MLWPKNPYLFDTFDIDGDNTANLSTCHLQYETGFYSELDYDSEFKLRIFNDLIKFRYRKNDYKSRTKLQVANFSELCLPHPLLGPDIAQRKCNRRSQ